MTYFLLVNWGTRQKNHALRLFQPSWELLVVYNYERHNAGIIQKL